MPTVTIVVPTFNESGNVAELLRRLTAVREEAHIDEVIFVDDSTDNTPDVISTLADGELPVRLVHRSPDQRAGGLSGAVVTGIAAAKSPWVLVMDADLQHPPEDVPRLMEAADDPHVDTVVASRYCAGGRSAGLSNGMRRLVSTGSTRLAALLFPLRLRRCTDSMTGFFAVRRDAIDIGSLQPRGFKILLEILVRHRVRIVEVPFTFARRLSGDSKASAREGLHFVVQLAQLRWQMWWATKRAREMVMFGGVGVANLLVDVGLFNLLLLGFRHEAAGAKAISTTVATIASYFMNRHWTWRDRTCLGVHRELPVFALLSAIGLVLAEACLWVSHDLLGYTSALADNVAANGVGLMIGMVWRFLSFKKWVFTAPLVPAETGGDRHGAVPIAPTGARRSRELIDVD